MAVWLASIILGVLALALTTVLVAAHRLFAVEVDERLAALVRALPGNNCGACGEPGCEAFAHALLEGRAQPAACTVGSAESQERIARFLGVAVGAVDKMVARLACGGGDNVARRLARYAGPARCVDAAQVAGGGKACAWGCLGLGDCEAVCDFDAIALDDHGLPVVDESACTACGDCVTACPKDLFSLVPAAERVWVACANPEAGNDLVEDCAVACTACGKCAFDAPEHLRMEANLPRRIAPGVPRAAIDRCPTGAIVWFDGGRPQRGADASIPVRTSPLAISATPLPGRQPKRISRQP